MAEHSLPEIAPIVAGQTRLGWIGTGLMGSSMCGHLVDRGFGLTVYNRTRTKAEPLLAKGRDGPRARGPSPKPRTPCSRSSGFPPMSAP